MVESRIEYTNQGYSYIKVEHDECLEWGGLGICDSCLKPLHPGYLVFILNSCMCEDCFNEWKARAKKYEDDIALQEANHLNYYKAHLERR